MMQTVKGQPRIIAEAELAAMQTQWPVFDVAGALMNTFSSARLPWRRDSASKTSPRLNHHRRACFLPRS